MSLPQAYNPRFIQYYHDNGRPDLQTLGDYGISIFKAPPGPAFRVVGIHHLSGKENGGNHHIFADILDEHGHRIEGAVMRIQVDDAPPTYAIVDKPANEPGTNAPMWARQQYKAKVAYVEQSDMVIGLHTGHPDEPGGGNTWGHHSFYIVWMYDPRGAAPEPDEPKEQPPVDVTPVEPPIDDQALKLIVDSLVSIDVALGQIKQDLEQIKAAQRGESEIRRQVAAVMTK